MVGIFFGCTTMIEESLRQALETFLEKAGIEYERLGVDQCCGIPLILSGSIDEAKQHAERVVEQIKTKGVDRLVTSCPHCYTAFSHEYPDMLGIDVPFQTLHFSQFARELIREGKIKPSKKVALKLTYHDPCYIGRKGDDIYDEPREVLMAIPGVELVETNFNRRETTCCGAGGLLRAVLPKLSVEIAKEKIESQVVPAGAEGVVSSCPFCYLNLREGAAEFTDKEVGAYDLVQLLVESLGDSVDA